MRTFEELEAFWQTRLRPPIGRGIVELIVVRPVSGQRLTPPRVDLSPEQGVHGDRWLHAEKRVAGAQISLLDARIAEFVAHGQDHALFGDNFLVDLDLAMDAMPEGANLAIGSARLQVSEVPHTGCKKYVERFGSEAMRWISHKEHRARRLRGIYCRVSTAGSVALGDTIEIVPGP